MCGIAGVFHLGVAKPVTAQRLAVMIAAQAHRGPDDLGIWTAAGIGLGHRRLAVIDPAGSAQPMRSADGQIVVTFNGEIYNFREVRAELQRLGHVFQTKGDTEVLIHAYRQWGAAMLPRLDGIFAFALYDEASSQVLLARDRLGVKPLHYALLADGSVAFASELKGLLALPGFRRTIRATAIEDYFALGYVPDDACFIDGVEKLPAGHFLILRQGKTMGRPTCWWEVDFSGRHRRSSKALEEELHALLRTSVASRMVADVPLGAFLSGGLDSASVIALIAETSAVPTKSFTIGFGSSAEDETRFARQVAKRFRADAHEADVGAPNAGDIGRIAEMFDEPFADPSAWPMTQLAAMARQHVTVALSGDGADEVFAGYRRYRFHIAEDRVRQALPASLRAIIFGGLGHLYPKADWAPRPLRAKRSLQALAMDEATAYARSVGFLVPEMRTSLFSANLMRDLQGYRAEERFVDLMAHAPARNALDRAQYIDFKTWLPGDILTKLDRTSMAVGLEVREPLLDHRLVEFAARLPSTLRLHLGEGKRLFKRVMAQHLPKDIVHRPKQGFVPPLADWFRAELAGPIRQMVTKSLLLDTGWFNSTAIKGVLEAHLAGRGDHSRLLWQLLIFEATLAHQLNQGSAPQ